MSKTSWYALSLVSVLCLFAIAWTCVSPQVPSGEELRESPAWCAVCGWLQQAANSVGSPINVYPGDPTDRLQVLIFESDDFRELRDEWSRYWFEDMPSHLTPERVHGGIMP